MQNPDEYELAAMQSAAEQAGKYIDSLGRTDMSAWTGDEWTNFIFVVCAGYVDAILATQERVRADREKVMSPPPF